MRRLIYRGIIVVFSAVLSTVIIIEGLILLEGNKRPVDEVDYLIILGARLYGDRPSPSLLERLKVAFTYLEDHKDVKVVVSGGQGIDEDVSEAYAMRQYLLDHGIEDSRIIVEDQSTNTFENLDLSLKKIKENDSGENIKVLIASNKYHILRAKMLAKRLGMAPQGLPAEIPPSQVIKAYAREYFAFIKSLIYDQVGVVTTKQNVANTHK